MLNHPRLLTDLEMHLGWGVWTHLMNLRRASEMILAECAILLLGSLKVLALWTMYLTSQTRADIRLRGTGLANQPRAWHRFSQSAEGRAQV